MSRQVGALNAYNSDRICDMLNSLRAQFGVEDIPFNQLHGSSSVEDATKEVEYFFPTEHTLGVIKPNALSEKGIIYIYTVDNIFYTHLMYQIISWRR